MIRRRFSKRSRPSVSSSFRLHPTDLSRDTFHIISYHWPKVKQMICLYLFSSFILFSMFIYYSEIMETERRYVYFALTGDNFHSKIATERIEITPAEKRNKGNIRTSATSGDIYMLWILHSIVYRLFKRFIMYA